MLRRYRRSAIKQRVCTLTIAAPRSVLTIHIPYPLRGNYTFLINRYLDKKLLFGVSRWSHNFTVGLLCWDNSPNSACTMGFWRFQGLVILCRPGPVPGHAKSLKNLQFLSFFKKNGAGARVLRSTFSFFDECFS